MEPNPMEKEEILKLKFAHLAPEIWGGLAGVERQGWLDRNVPKPVESVQLHTLALKRVAREVTALIPEFTEAEIEDLLDMLEIHDWSEAIDGDEVIYTADELERKTKKELKFAREQKTMVEICAPLGEIGQQIMNFWMRFETSADKVSSLARQIDKYQAMEQAAEYEKTHNIPGLFKEFYDYSLKDVSDPILLERLAKIKGEIMDNL